ncbi:MAG: hypothetical protein JKY42_02830 [Flavobacteriales bacterium]|nr:hypothetical protein [Flavobacteriales bacterium]
MRIRELKNKTFARIEQLTDEGKSKSEIADELFQETDDKWHKVVFRWVAYHVKKDQREQYKTIGYLLTSLVAISAVLMIPMYYEWFQTRVLDGMSVGVTCLFALIQIQLLVGALKWNGRIYRSIIIIEGLKLYSLISEYMQGNYSQWIMGYILVIVLELVVAAYLYRKIFPTYGFFGPKKDRSGSRLLDDTFTKD